MKVSCDDVEIAGYIGAQDLVQFRDTLVTPECFLNEIRQGAPNHFLPTAIAIPKFPSVYRAIGEIFKAKNIPNTEIVDKRWLNLRGICPDCGCVLTGDSLGSLYMMSVDGWDNITVWGPGRAFRWAKGTCVNEQCTATHILLVWFPLHELIQAGKDMATLTQLVAEDKYWFSRKKAAERLASIQSEGSLRSLVQAVSDKDVEVRLVAVQGLRNFRHPLAVDALRRSIQTDEEQAVRDAATASLADIEQSQ